QLRPGIGRHPDLGGPEWETLLWPFGSRLYPSERPVGAFDAIGARAYRECPSVSPIGNDAVRWPLCLRPTTPPSLISGTSVVFLSLQVKFEFEK
ncbi:unnamed protein product, partial [Nesidiocoris tenuis]